MSGLIKTDKWLYEPLMAGWAYGASFEGSLTATCAVPSGALPIDGFMYQSACRLVDGVGTVYDPAAHDFTFEDAGGVWVLTGSVQGSLLFTPVGDCTYTGASPGNNEFRLDGTITTS